jgi:hypothetical protein
MKRGFIYLFADFDWASRCVLAWRLLKTLTTDFYIEAVQEVIHRYVRQTSGTVVHSIGLVVRAEKSFWLIHESTQVDGCANNLATLISASCTVIDPFFLHVDIGNLVFGGDSVPKKHWAGEPYLIIA